MWIFVPLFVLLFIAVPGVLTRLVAKAIGIRDRAVWFVLFMAIAVLNWQAWQRPVEHVAQASAQQ